MELLSDIPDECIVSIIHLLSSDIRHRLLVDLAHRVSSFSYMCTPNMPTDDSSSCRMRLGWGRLHMRLLFLCWTALFRPMKVREW